jgi:biotin operon repressor
MARITEVLLARDAIPSDKDLARELAMSVKQVKHRIHWLRKKRATRVPA